MKYKTSKFNYSCKNKHGELLLFNSYRGLESICKIRDSSIQDYFLAGIFEENNNILTQLKDKGFILSANIDENHMLNLLINKIISPSDLKIVISCTEKCNFRCIYCYESHQNITITNEIRSNIISYVRNSIHKHNALSVSWFGGEPLLEKDLIIEMSKELIAICVFNRRSYSAFITTNGYLLDIDTFQKLLDCRIRMFQITIDGIKSVHDKQRPTESGSGTFEVIIENLIKIKALKKRNFHIIIRTNITYLVYENLNQYIDIISSICESDDRFSIMIHYASAWKAETSIVLDDKIIKDRDDVIPLYKSLINSGKKIKYSFMIDPQNASCFYASENRFFIRPNGEIHKCSVFSENEKNIVGEFENGRIVLNDAVYSKFIDHRQCKNLYNCFYAPVCKGDICPASRANNKECPTSKKHLDYILNLIDIGNTIEIIR